MRIPALAIALLSVGLPSTVLSYKTPPTFVGDSKKVPGESPLEYCNGDHTEDIVHIKSVDLSPNPPQPGQELIINAVGTVKERINKGAYVLLTVKYGVIRLISTNADLCEQMGNVELECPIEPGVIKVSKTVALPAEIPPGNYHVQADVYNNNDKQITCLTASVEFKKSGALGFFDL